MPARTGQTEHSRRRNAYRLRARPFLDKSWHIHAFKPDDRNWQNPLDAFAAHANKQLLTLDARCVSNEPRDGLSFYRSEESTGISGLSVFHEPNIEAQRVRPPRSAVFFDNQAISVIYFLKTDTEWHDIFVLPGFPWNLGRPTVIEFEFEDAKTLAPGLRLPQHGVLHRG